MSNSYGEHIRLTIFGQSHSKAIGMTLEGIPAGQRIDMEKLQAFLNRRAPGRDALSTARKEADVPEFLSGLVDNVTCGTALTAIIYNKDTKSKDYSQLKDIPRPGHADYTAAVKYNGYQDHAGGGHFSGRMTAPLCIAGGICKQLLEQDGIQVNAKIVSVGYAHEEAEIREYILAKKAEGDSCGGIIECEITGLPAGIGDHIFGGMENRISQAVFGIPAIKGIEFGAGFAVAEMTGSENNDAFFVEEGQVKTKTNHCGGILGGITTGMPLVFRVAVKPTPSIFKPQQSVDLRTMEETQLVIEGRHDPCIVPRAVPCVEAAAAISVYDAMRENQ